MILDHHVFSANGYKPGKLSGDILEDESYLHVCQKEDLCLKVKLKEKALTETSYAQQQIIYIYILNSSDLKQ